MCNYTEQKYYICMWGSISRHDIAQYNCDNDEAVALDINLWFFRLVEKF